MDKYKTKRAPEVTPVVTSGTAFTAENIVSSTKQASLWNEWTMLKHTTGTKQELYANSRSLQRGVPAHLQALAVLSKAETAAKNQDRARQAEQMKKTILANALFAANSSAGKKAGDTELLYVPNQYHLLAWITEEMAANCSQKRGEDFSRAWFY